MSETTLRKCLMLSLLPRAPRKVDTASLERSLASRGFAVDRRSIQRDLNHLGRIFPIACDQRSRPFGWSWSRDAKPLAIPTPDPHAALVVLLADELVGSMLPPATARYLAPHVTEARKVLGDKEDGLDAWPRRVRVVPRSQPLRAPEIRAPVAQAVYEGVLRQKRMKIRYRSRAAASSKPREINPLGLLFRDGLSYLVVTFSGYEDIRQLAMHRISTAELLDDDASPPEGFDMREYARSPEMGVVLHDDPISLKVRFDRRAAALLLEAPLSDDQAVRDIDDDTVEVTATVADTRTLRCWLLGFGPLARVLAPDHLVDSFRQTTARMADAYR